MVREAWDPGAEPLPLGQGQENKGNRNDWVISIVLVNVNQSRADQGIEEMGLKTT